jgi:hypothetical protein
VQLVTLDEMAVAELSYGERVIWRRELARRGLVAMTEYELMELTRAVAGIDAVFRSELTGETCTLNADQIVVERGTLPFGETFDSLRDASNNQGITDVDALIAGKPQPGIEKESGYSLFRIGDASSSRNLAAAMYDALRLCSVI